VHRHLNALNSLVLQACSGNSVGQSLDQVQRVPFHISHHRPGQAGVVDRLTKIVSGRRPGQVEPAGEVDDKGLAALPLGR
jgi:hypothetical protein